MKSGLSFIVTNVLGAPTSVVPSEKQPPTVIPIVSQSEELDANGTYKFSYETGNGIKREETSYDKIIPNATSRGASSEEDEESDEDDNSNEIHVQRGSYSYTAPDGTVITVSYIADENGFQPVGNHLPRSPAPAPILSNIIAKSKSVLKSLDNSESDSMHLPMIEPPNSVPVITARLANKGPPSESITQKTSETSTISKSLENSATTVTDIAKQNSESTESAVLRSSVSENNSKISTTTEYGNDVSKPAKISTISESESEANSKDSATTVLNSSASEEKSDAAETITSTSLHSADISTTESADMKTSQSTDQLEKADSPSNTVVGVKQVNSETTATSHESLTETVSDAEVSTTSKSVYTSDSSEDKTTKDSGEETTLAVAVASDTTEDADLVSMEEVTEKAIDGSTSTDSDTTNDGTESSNLEVSTLASSA